MNKQYKINYLPLFYEDLASVTNYVTKKLNNPTAAQNLIDRTEEAIMTRLSNPDIFEPYHSTRSRKHPYYRIKVNNFSVFYVLIDDVMEVRRFLYNGRDIPDLL
ncbi:MAG: type II toxin-antitoxin system RelE/ParE family toxin [Ruminococcus sp.]|nr:type II toxin-antitoxin system RelE/ParE family toxin [Ruminococcus sp.]MEE1171669.1 type II toxin-antitoxin system RelE/ParE family toxin [Ruminococcus sp.]